MRKLLAWLGTAMLLVVMSASTEAAGTALKPYVVLILDTSGSMIYPTGSGPPSCGGTDSKLHHAVCAINNIVNSYGDMVFAFAKFHETPGGTYAGNCNRDCTSTGIFCGGCDTTPIAFGGTGAGCSSTMDADNLFQLLTPLVDGNNAQTAEYTDFVCTTCSLSLSPNNPEIWDANSWTPLNASFKGDKRYWQGLQASDGTVYWPSNQPGFNPIVNDPTNNQFLPAGTGCDPSPTCTTNCCTSQCRPYITIILTDGDETCSVINNSWPAVGNVTTSVAITATGATESGSVATFTTSSADGFSLGDVVVVKGVGVAGYNGTWTVRSLVSTTKFTVTLPTTGLAASGGGTVGFAPGLLATDVVTNGVLKRYKVETKAIGFGTTVPYPQMENIALAGGATPIPGQNAAFYASDEAGVELAITKIIEGSLRTEKCNKLDDDCDGLIDEDFPCASSCTGPSCTPACNACTNGKLGVCMVAGTQVCTADGSGVTCNAGTAPCAGQVDGTACSVTDTANIVESGTCTAGICYPTPQTVCPAGKTCNPDHTEVCGDGLDNDCDGFVDEGCTTCTPTTEICNGFDDDCDGIIDENIPPRQCAITNAFGTCVGTQTCSNPFNAAMPYTACVGKTPTAETCNGLDDDCDGIIDEDLTVGCSNMGKCSNNAALYCAQNSDCGAGNTCNIVLGGPAADNPGDASHSPIPQNICHPGTKQCVAGAYTACTGEQTPNAEICNGLDDDCDNVIDENTGGGTCSTTCGVGTVVCATSPNCGGVGQPQCGTLYCNAQPAGNDASCDGVDEDCDGLVDEDWKCSDPSGNSTPAVACACTPPAGQCNGQNKCLNGTVQCVGTPVDPSSCCDCNGTPQQGMCGGGSSCAANCQCAYPCSGGEFPCPLAKKCTAGFCVNDPCYGVTCPNVNGNKQICVDNGNNTGTCMDACTQQTCPSPEICYGPTGQCRANDCTTFPNLCTASQNCVVDANGMGQCVSNPCIGVSCPQGQYCESGNCYGSCSGVTCPNGQLCKLGTCQTDPCGHPCPAGQACNDATGVCINDPCQFRQCPQGDWCNPNDGQCEADPCVGTMCPVMGQICRGGTCYDPTQLGTDGGMETHVTVGGGGCETTGGGSGGAMLLGVILMVVRRRRGGRS